MNSGTGSNLNGVWGSSGSDVFAVGADGTIVHYDGATWTPMSSGTSAELFSVWGSNSDNIFAVGYDDFSPLSFDDTIVHYDGATWTPIPIRWGAKLHGVWGSSSSDVYAVSSGGIILHYDGTTWTPIPSGTSVSLGAVWGSSSSDIFAVGYDLSAEGGPGTVLHYDGATWTRMLGGISVALGDVWGSSGSDVFAVGGGGIILHYNGTTWTYLPSGTSGYLAGVWGSSGSDVFAVGEYGTILHYDGATWAPMPSGTYASLYGVWGSSSSDVFAVGGYGTILHYDGATWTPMPSGTSARLTGVWGSSSSDVFAVGGDGFAGDGTVLHYNGNTWTAMVSGHYSFYDVWGSSGSDVFVVGVQLVSLGGRYEARILHYDGSTWKLMWSPDLNYSLSLYSIWGSSSSDVFAVGWEFIKGGAILHYNGTTWIPMTSGTSVALNDVWGSSGDDVFAVGSNGVILHYDGSTWTRLTSGTSNGLAGVWEGSGSNVFAVGDVGTILHYSVPVATGDFYTTTEDSVLEVAAPGILGNDSDADYNNLTIASHTPPSGGALTLNGDGAFVYQPRANFCGQDHFTYTLSDSMMGTATANVILDVACVNDPPVAGDDEYATSEDCVLKVAAPGVLRNDSNVESDRLTVISSGPPGTGTLTLPVYGILTLNEDGAFTYQPMFNFCGEDRYAYSVRSIGGIDTGALTIHVTCVNDPPSLGAITGLPNLVPVGAAISVTVTFTDPDRGDIFIASWDWGDGATSPGVIEPTAQLVTGSHTGYAPGVYTVRLVLFDQAGARSNEVTAEVVVAAINRLYLPLVNR
jgi:hypothetical protein